MNTLRSEQTDAAGAAGVLRQALAWLDEGVPVALVTVVQAWAMAPRRAGSWMAMTADGRSVGSVSANLVDDDVLAAARAALSQGSAGRLHYDIDDDQACSAGLACGGGLTLRVDLLTGQAGDTVGVLREAEAAMTDRRSFVLCVPASGGRHRLVPTVEARAAGDRDELARLAWQHARTDLTATATADGENVLFQVFNAPLRLFIVGAGNIAQALVPAARLVGYEVTVIDPRPAMATAERFPDATLAVDEPDVALRAVGLDDRSAVVTLSHAAAIDDPALCAALDSPAFYVGSLGSRRTHAARLERLHAAGVPQDRTARIHGPAGLSIGAVGSAEIAASIVAELIAALRPQR